MNRSFLRYTAILGMALLASAVATAQTSGLGSWNVISGKITFTKKWFGFAEAQLRSQKMVHDFHYYEYKGGVGYNFPKNISLLVAMGDYKTFQPDGDFKKPYVGNEFRLWEQLTITNNIDRVKLEHRYRVEQRFMANGDYRNRFRYRLSAIVPLNHATVKPKTVYASVFNELFVTNEEPYYEQNRIFLGAGYQFDEHVTLQMGWLNRFDQNTAHITTWKNYFQTTLMLSIDEFKSGRERHPGTVD